MAGRVEGSAAAAESGIDGAGDGAGVADVESGAVGAECDAVGLCKGVIDEECCTGGRVEAVACCGQLWSGIGEGVEPGVVRVGEEDVASFGVYSNVVDGVEVSAEVVVEQDVGLVCGGSRVRTETRCSVPPMESLPPLAPHMIKPSRNVPPFGA